MESLLELSQEEIRTRAAQALANLEAPDYSGIADRQVYQAFAQVWNGFTVDQEWLSQFKAQVATLSGGRVSLESANPERFEYRVKGPAEYLLLKAGGVELNVILGPYSQPVTIER